MLAVLESIDDQNPYELAHTIARWLGRKVKFTHRKGESVFDRDREPKSFVVILHPITQQRGLAAKSATATTRKRGERGTWIGKARNADGRLL